MDIECIHSLSYWLISITIATPCRLPRSITTTRHCQPSCPTDIEYISFLRPVGRISLAVTTPCLPAVIPAFLATGHRMYSFLRPIGPISVAATTPCLSPQSITITHHCHPSFPMDIKCDSFPRPVSIAVTTPCRLSQSITITPCLPPLIFWPSFPMDIECIHSLVLLATFPSR